MTMSNVTKHTKANCERLAKEIVDGMDLKDLIYCMIERLTESYEQSEETFQEDWNDMGMDEMED
jgi:hypothetical protein